MEFIIISGLSGAGKSRAADVLEDLNYYCVDNMPVILIPKFAELCMSTHSTYERVVLVTDIREKQGAGELLKALDELLAMGCRYRILFIEADMDVIVKRYKETRRRHPLADGGGSIEDAVRREMAMMKPMRDRAEHVINTSRFTLAALQSALYKLFVGDGVRKLVLNIISFGFKYGIPLEADLVFDVRFLPNPYYVEEFRHLTGEDKRISDFALDNDIGREFLLRTKEYIAFLLPLYTEEGKSSLTIAVGCTGGRHRSVAVAKEMSDFTAGELGHTVQLINRDSNL